MTTSGGYLEHIGRYKPVTAALRDAPPPAGLTMEVGQ